MLETKLYDSVEDALLRYVVIIAKHKGQWVFCRHKERDTYECPGGHREAGETIAEAARRELWEETGAKRFTLSPICAYSARDTDDDSMGYGMVYAADIEELGELPEFEMAEVKLMDELPERWTYPDIQRVLMSKYLGMGR